LRSKTPRANPQDWLDGNDFGGAGDAVEDDSFDALLEGHCRHGATAASSHQLQVDCAALYAEQDKVTTVGLQSRTYVFECLGQSVHIDV